MVSLHTTGFDVLIASVFMRFMLFPQSTTIYPKQHQTVGL